MKTRRARSPDPVACPCGGRGSYADCCGRYHPGGPEAGRAPTAEALMRSRYSAYVLGLVDYLLATWHADTRPARIEPDPPGLRWLGLQVLAHRLVDADHAVVEFVARHKLGGRAFRLHEVSRFAREREAAGQRSLWLYVDGDSGSA